MKTYKIYLELDATDKVLVAEFPTMMEAIDLKYKLDNNCRGSKYDIVYN